MRHWTSGLHKPLRELVRARVLNIRNYGFKIYFAETNTNRIILCFHLLVRCRSQYGPLVRCKPKIYFIKLLNFVLTQANSISAEADLQECIMCMNAQSSMHYETLDRRCIKFLVVFTQPSFCSQKFASEVLL